MVEATTARTMDSRIGTVGTVGEDGEDLVLGEYLIGILLKYKQEFREYFYNQCREIIDYFANCQATMAIKAWFFHDGNLEKFPLSARGLFDNIKGLSRMNGLSFIKQFNLADKLEHSTRWVRDIASRLKRLALLFSIKTDKINYCLTFDLGKSVSEYFSTLVTLLFDNYSTISNTPSNSSTSSNTSGNTQSESSSTSSSEPSAEPSAGSQGEFSLAKLLFTKLCSYSQRIESKILGRKKKKEEKSKEGMHPSVASAESSQPATTTTSINLSDQEKEASTNNTTSNYNNNSSNTSFTIIIGNTMKINHNNVNNTANNANTITSISSNEKPVNSIYNYKLCERYTIEYAKMKFGTSDEIENIGAFARYCYRTGEKDIWIKLFVENNYTITPYNPLKNNDIEQNISHNQKQTKQQNVQQHSQQNNQPKTDQSGSDSMANSDENGYSSGFESLEQVSDIKESQKPNSQVNQVNQVSQIKVENQGKFTYETYLDFVERRERPRLERIGRKVYSAKALAESMLNTGNDDKRVAKFVELMKSSSIGARPSDFNSPSTVITTALATEPTPAEKLVLAAIKQDFDYQTRFETLEKKLWQQLSVSDQESLLIQEIKELRATKYFDSHYQYWPKAILREHAINQAKKRLAKVEMSRQEASQTEISVAS